MSDVSDIQGLSDLGACAYALGMTFGREAKAATDDERMLRYLELFHQCFHGFRVAVALKLRLRREASVALRAGAEDLRSGTGPRPVEPAERAERDPPEQERIERERPERERIEYDRDREAASLPILLKTLNGVVAQADALPGPQPSELPTLRDLLARLGHRPGTRAAPPPPEPDAPPTGGAGTGLALLARPPAETPKTRADLLRGAGSAGLTGVPRRSTGPP
ncbi:MAG: hypothetical protein U1C74_07435 [Phenylobacterium sp.]|nr:hypothetical protein [Phenylobacterium sp.]